MGAERDEFEAAIDEAIAAGRDAGPERLVYADWLDERGEIADACLADALARLPPDWRRE
jgi:uncharacterized protein (TIGR02996 family)